MLSKIFGSPESTWRTCAIAALLVTLFIGGAVMRSAFAGALMLLINIGSIVLLALLFAQRKRPEGRLGKLHDWTNNVLEVCFGSFMSKRIVDITISAGALVLGAISGSVLIAATVGCFGLLVSILTSCLPNFHPIVAPA